MRLGEIDDLGFGSSMQVFLAQKAVNRSLLKGTKSNLKPLAGPEEVRKAKNWVAAYTAGNAGVAAAMAQVPGADEVALAGVEVAMAAHIIKGIYKFDLSKNALKIIGTGLVGHKIGSSAFKWLSKSVTWIPLLGNTVNAVIAGSTTAALGAALIKTAEFMDEQRKKANAMDEIMKKLQEFIKNMGL